MLVHKAENVLQYNVTAYKYRQNTCEEGIIHCIFYIFFPDLVHNVHSIYNFPVNFCGQLLLFCHVCILHFKYILWCFQCWVASQSQTQTQNSGVKCPTSCTHICSILIYVVVQYFFFALFCYNLLRKSNTNPRFRAGIIKGILIFFPNISRLMSFKKRLMFADLIREISKR